MLPPRRQQGPLLPDKPVVPPRAPWSRVFAAGVVLGALAMALAIVFVTNARRGDPAAAAAFLAANRQLSGVRVTPSGLQYRILAPGSGPSPGDGDRVTIAYDGRLADGTRFDRSDRATFAVGEVVPGFGEALRLMPRGSRVRAWISPRLGYGTRRMGPIPPQSVLVFDITMIDFGAVD